MMEVNLNLDNFCPICYNDEQIMRNVYKKLDDDSDLLYCPKHGFVMVEDIDLKRYQETNILDINRLPQNNNIVGGAIIGKAVIANYDTLYSNSVDFGDYDYNGNPNLIRNIAFDDWVTEGAVNITKENNNIEISKKAGSYGLVEVNEIGSILPNTQYTLSIDIYVTSDTSVDQLKECNIAIEGIYNEEHNYYGTTTLDKITKLGKWYRSSSTFTTATFTTNEYSDKLTKLKFRAYFNPDAEISIKISNNIKLEKGSLATPYQPNLLGAPYYLGSTPLGKNIANPKQVFPINTTDYYIYGGTNTEKYVAGQQYTLTMQATKPYTQSFGVYVDNGITSVGTMERVSGLANVWSLTFYVTQEHIDKGVSNIIQIYQIPRGTTGKCSVTWLKLEKGNIRTPNIESYNYTGKFQGEPEELQPFLFCLRIK